MSVLVVFCVVVALALLVFAFLPLAHQSIDGSVTKELLLIGCWREPNLYEWSS